MIVVIVAALACAAPPVLAGEARPAPAREPDPARVTAAARLMKGLAAESRRQAARIRATYEDQVARLALRDRGALRSALDDGRLMRVPAAAPSVLQLRLAGDHPIGEMDLPHQPLYVAARPETIGCLLDVAARVGAGPLEVTSLVRHRAYQRSLARRNANARTAVPTHVMGLAFDISVLHAPLAVVRELRGVLTEMAADGDLYFVAEQRQLVFHVVPAPARRHRYIALADALSFPRPVLAPPAWPLVPADELKRLVVRAEAERDEAAAATRPAGYAALFGLMVTSGLGTPPGEDLFVAGVGALAAEGVLAWWPVLLLAIVAVVSSDAVMFQLGRAAQAAAAQPWHIPARVLEGIDGLLHRWSGPVIAAARFFPGIRGLVFFVAGARGVSTLRFLLIDGCAALVWVPLAMTFGAWVISAVLGDGSLAAVEVRR